MIQTPQIDRLAKEGDSKKIQFKCGQFKDSFDFSFSGIKTGVLYYTQKSGKLSEEINDICACFQKSVISDIVKKTIALCIKKKVGFLAVGGGVSANSLLREMLTFEGKKNKIKVVFPPMEQSLDNGAMIARYGRRLFQKGQVSDLSLTAVPGLSI